MKITRYNMVMNLMQFRFGQSTMTRDDTTTLISHQSTLSTLNYNT